MYANLEQLNTSQKTSEEGAADKDKTPTAREPHTPNGTAIQVREIKTMDIGGLEKQ